jgi:hypothetical protein
MKITKYNFQLSNHKTRKKQLFVNNLSEKKMKFQTSNKPLEDNRFVQFLTKSRGVDIELFFFLGQQFRFCSKFYFFWGPLEKKSHQNLGS